MRCRRSHTLRRCTLPSFGDSLVPALPELTDRRSHPFLAEHFLLEISEETKSVSEMAV
jgi:hypothetical protein